MSEGGTILLNSYLLQEEKVEEADPVSQLLGELKAVTQHMELNA